MLVWKGLNDLVVDVLLVLMNCFVFVLKYFINLWVITPLPHRGPRKLQHFIFANRVFVNIPKVKDICTVLRDILNVAPNVMNSLATILELSYPLFVVQHHKVRLHTRIRVDPDVDESVDLFGDKLPLFSVLLSLLPTHSFAVLPAETVVVFDGFGHDGFAVVV